MGIRIDIHPEGHFVVLYLAGRLVGATVLQLTEACEPIENNFILDLSKLMFTDEQGVNVIRSLRDKGAKIRGASTFVKLLLNGETVH